jgi:RNA-directed DNA polymerase
MVWQAYKKVKANKGSAGIDDVDWEELEKDLSSHLYTLWNRLSSGSYFPEPVKEVAIAKKSGGIRKLGIPTILDRIAQKVVKTHLERILEPLFHNSSYGYRPGRSCHQAVEQARNKILKYDWVIDLDIKSFFDRMDHTLLLKALAHYCKDKWVLLYVERWLKAGIITKEGAYLDRVDGSPQGGVISPLLANLFLHVAFDEWMQKVHPDKPFVRYADDCIVHCKSEKQALYLLKMIRYRLQACKLELNEQKSKIVNLRGQSERKYPRSFDFLGFTIRPLWMKTKGGCKLMPNAHISRKAASSALEKFRTSRIHCMRKGLREVAKVLNPIARGVINYYCKFSGYRTNYIWHQLNVRLVKWVMWEKGLYKRAAVRWLRTQCRENPTLFAHWKLVYP